MPTKRTRRLCLTRLDALMMACADKHPVRVCRSCGLPVVGFGIHTCCPKCGKAHVLIGQGMRPWDKPLPWAPEYCLVVVDEEST